MSASTSIVVVGGGIVAASAAYHLARGGVAVTVVEGDQAGAATDAGAGIICPWTARHRDEVLYHLSAAGARYYPDLIAMLADDGQDDTGYARVGALCVAPDPDQLSAAAQVLASRRADRPEVGEISRLEPGEPARLFPPLAASLAGVWIGGGARVDGRQIRDSLLGAAASRGARRVRGNAVLAGRGARVTGVTVRGDRIEADHVVVAAGAWTAQLCAGYGPRLPIGPQRGQIVHAEIGNADSSSWPVVLPPGDPYLLAFPAGRLVFGATREDAGFDYRTTVGGVAGLLARAVELAPGLAEASMLEVRIGFRPASTDGRPVLGRLADGLVVAAGNGPEGLTAGPWTGLAAAQIALGERPAMDLAPFDPHRFAGAVSGAVLG
ncbi:MAG TPA: FAD-binding oxidoreductase [Streptosporangiaceae bacterium]|nr:FAD-binding oxidoreductase [Streptosporangiaceae bacterium]